MDGVEVAVDREAVGVRRGRACRFASELGSVVARAARDALAAGITCRRETHA